MDSEVLKSIQQMAIRGDITHVMFIGLTDDKKIVQEIDLSDPPYPTTTNEGREIEIKWRRTKMTNCFVTNSSYNCNYTSLHGENLIAQHYAGANAIIFKVIDYNNFKSC